MKSKTALLTLAWTAGLVLTGCDRKPSATDPAVQAAIRDSITAFLAARYSAFEKGSWDVWSGQMADDVFLVAADPGRALTGRDSIRTAMQADYAPALAAGLTMRIVPDTQLIWLADSGTVAAVTSDLDYDITIQDRHIPLKLRATTLMGRDSSGWKVLVEHYSRMLPYDSLFNALVSRRVQAPASMGLQVRSEAGELMNLFRKDMRDLSKMPLSPDAVVVTPGEIVQGEDAVRRALTAWLGPPGNATESNTGMRAALAPDARTGWVATTLYVPIFAGPESSVAPIRVLLIYHIAGDHWEVVRGHFSVGWSQGS